MGVFDNEQKDSFEKFKQQTSFKDKEGKVTTFKDESLVAEVYSNIHTQLNDVARMGVLDIPQWKQFKDDMIEGVFILIYIKNYKNDEDLIDKDAFFIASKNYGTLLSTRVLNGRDRAILLADIEAKKQTIVMGRA